LSFYRIYTSKYKKTLSCCWNIPAFPSI